MKEKVDFAAGVEAASDFIAVGGGEGFFVVGAGATTGFSFAAAARAASDVPGFLDADIKAEKGLGTGLDGTAAAAAGLEAAAGGALEVPFAASVTDLALGAVDSNFFRSAFCKANGFEDCLMVVGTTVRFVAGKGAPSASRGRFRPAVRVVF